MSSDPDTVEGEEAAAAGKPETATETGETLRAGWFSRRARCLVPVTAIVVLVVIVAGVVVAFIPRPPATMEERLNALLSERTLASLKNASSPQSRAYEWATEADQVPGRDAPHDDETRIFRMTQRFALATLFYSLGLDNWVGSTVSECNWGRSAGGQVKCNDATQVVALNPNGAGRVPSSIPREIVLLSNLAYLDLRGNSLTSSIPTELGQLSALTHLDLDRNSLTSSIPTELGQLTALKHLTLYHNSLASSIPTELGRLSKLQTLWLDVNHLTGTFPSALCSVGDIDLDCREVTCRCCTSDDCTDN
jgi:Leucine rich repeat